MENLISPRGQLLLGYTIEDHPDSFDIQHKRNGDEVFEVDEIVKTFKEVLFQMRLHKCFS